MEIHEYNGKPRHKNSFLKNKLDSKILVSFMSNKAKNYRCHLKLLLSKTRSIDPNLGLLHNKVAYPCNKGANSITLYKVCKGAESLAG